MSETTTDPRHARLWTPPTPAGEAALAFAAEYADADLLAHSVRSYAFAAARAERDGLDVDAELLWVAALLHDLGLTDPFDSHALPFEEASGHVARAFTAGLGWSRARRDRVAEVIVLHMREDVPAAADAESHLLQVGTSADVSGLDVTTFPAEFREALVTAYPRGAFGAAFLAHMTAQSARKPASAAAGLVENGVAARIATNPLDH
ncbi:HD domain-containing protein [Streptomyces sp. BI20]|uniref:HD domain-containing protein n=1 Tax=Streptomyces sp. BI20 TaxID=3403460 RepID=UPI003C749583